jgi:hypothetical protein
MHRRRSHPSHLDAPPAPHVRPQHILPGRPHGSFTLRPHDSPSNNHPLSTPHYRNFCTRNINPIPPGNPRILAAYPHLCQHPAVVRVVLRLLHSSFGQSKNSRRTTSQDSVQHNVRSIHRLALDHHLQSRRIRHSRRNTRTRLPA